MEGRRQIDRQGAVPVLGQELLDRREVTDDGVVDQDVDAAEAARRPSRPGRRSGSARRGRRRDGVRARRGSSSSLRRRLSISAGSPKPFSTMLQPSAASRSAIAWPSPCVDPVMSAHLPFSMRFSQVLSRWTISNPRSILMRSARRALQAADEQLGAAPADLLPRNAQGRHGRHCMAQQIDVVEARDGDAARHRPAAALAFEQRAHRQHVAGEETGIEVGMGSAPAAPAHRRRR